MLQLTTNQIENIINKLRNKTQEDILEKPEDLGMILVDYISYIKTIVHLRSYCFEGQKDSDVSSGSMYTKREFIIDEEFALIKNCLKFKDGYEVSTLNVLSIDEILNSFNFNSLDNNLLKPEYIISYLKYMYQYGSTNSYFNVFHDGISTHIECGDTYIESEDGSIYVEWRKPEKTIRACFEEKDVENLEEYEIIKQQLEKIGIDYKSLINSYQKD